MTIHAELTDGRIQVDGPLHLRQLMKDLPGSRYEGGIWTLPLAWASCLRLRAVFGAELQVGPELAGWARTEKLVTVDPAFAQRDLVVPVEDCDPRLYPFQQAGVRWLEVVDRALLADEVGSGKTIQAIIASLMREQPLPILVIAPKAVLFKWQREFEKWWPGLDVRVATGTAAMRRKAIEGGDVVIINWEAVRSHSRLAPFGAINLTEKEKTDGDLNKRAWRSVIIDEAHRMKSPQSKQTRAVWACAHQSSVRYVLAMTGTPIANQLDELWSVMHAVNPDEYPSKSKWIERYADKGWNMWGGLEIRGVRPDRRDEFFQIFDYRFRRMPKAVTLPQLPPIIGGLTNESGLDVREVVMESKQAKAYAEMRDAMVAELDEGNFVVTRPVEKVLRLWQFASAYAETYVDGDNKTRVKLTDPSCKVDALMDMIDEFDEPLVVFAASRQLLDLCADRMIKNKITFGRIVGGQTAIERQADIDRFQAGKLPVILAQFQAGSTGIDLTRSRIEIMLQRSYNLVDNIQAEGRIHRIGSEGHDNVRIIDVITKDTMEMDVVEALRRKDDNLQELCRDAQMLSKILS